MDPRAAEFQTPMYVALGGGNPVREITSAKDAHCLFDALPWSQRGILYDEAIQM